MAQRGAPIGNKNAVKDNRAWGDMVRRKVAQNPDKLEQAALSVLNAAAAGEPWAVTELRNTLDGKPIQPVANEHTFTNALANELTNAELAHVVATGELPGASPDSSIN